MIFIIRALCLVRKGWWRLIPPQVGMRLRTKIKKEGKKEGPKKWEKKREGTMLSFYRTCASNSTMIFMIESLLFFRFHILVGILHYRTWLVYSNDGLPQNALGLREQASWMHTHLVSFVELSYIYSSKCIRCMAIPTHSHWYLLMGISIARWYA